VTRHHQQPLADALTTTCLIDEMIERYVDWREGCTAVRAAYESWSSASPAERVTAFAIYNAALDQEECSARAYAASLHQLKRVLWTNRELDPLMSEAA